MIDGEYIGQIVSAGDIKRKGNFHYKWLACPCCGKPKWTRISVKSNLMRSPYCSECGVRHGKSSMSITEINKDSIIHKHCQEHQTLKQISKDLGLSISAISVKMKKWGIKVTRPNQSLNNGSHWKGGRVKSNSGYWDIRLAPDDFFYPMTRGNGYVREHRLVMAKHLGRCLLTWEVVHHKNGDKSDNRIENLQLLPHGKYHLTDTVSRSQLSIFKFEISKLKKENAGLKNQVKLLLQQSVGNQ